MRDSMGNLPFGVCWLSCAGKCFSLGRASSLCDDARGVWLKDIALSPGVHVFVGLSISGVCIDAEQCSHKIQHPTYWCSSLGSMVRVMRVCINVACYEPPGGTQLLTTYCGESHDSLPGLHVVCVCGVTWTFMWAHIGRLGLSSVCTSVWLSRHPPAG
jgi:hypothetical protein